MWNDKNMHKILIAFVLVLLSACNTLQTLQITETDPETGYFPSDLSINVVKNERFDIDSKKSLLLVRDQEFTGQIVKNIGYFDEIIDLPELEKIIAKNNLSESVPSVNDQIGIHKAAKAYKPFLQLRWDLRSEGRNRYQQLILTDPYDLEDYFICETTVSINSGYANDQNTFYPMMNAFIDYIKENSQTF